MIRYARHLWSILFLVPLFLPFTAVSRAYGTPHQVTGIRFWTSEEYTRVVIDVDGEVPYEANVLKADPARKLPPRIFVDIPDSGIGEEIVRRPVEVRNGLLKVVRAGRFRKGVVRVVIDLEHESGYRAFAMTDPFRIIVDIGGKGEADSGAAPPPRGRILVMLDPGHGGKDPGAIGPTGLREKDVTLAIGRLVRDRLLASKEFDVRMTRDGDTFIPLEERTAMANGAGADIFVSLHINASPNRKARGISTYVLSNASDREALELAARENGVPARKLSAVKFIIDDLSTTPRKNASLKLAKTVNDAIVRKVKTRFGPVDNLGLRQAPFYVLVGARMTAVLAETSFITNARDEARLRDPSYIETIAESVVEAVRYYGSKAIVARAGAGGE